MLCFVCDKKLLPIACVSLLLDHYVFKLKKPLKCSPDSNSSSVRLLIAIIIQILAFPTIDMFLQSPCPVGSATL